jgi:hypothetical protein
MGDSYLNDLKHQILKLQIASQHNQPNDNNLSVTELLDKYKVGTEQSKIFMRSIKIRKELIHCPLRQCRFLCPTNKLKLNGIDLPTENEIITNTTMEQISFDTYRQTCKTIHVFCKRFRNSDHNFLRVIPGFKLLAYRGSWDFDLHYKIRKEVNRC